MLNWNCTDFRRTAGCGRSGDSCDHLSRAPCLSCCLRTLLAVLALSLLYGCQSAPKPLANSDEQRFLITFAQHQFTPVYRRGGSSHLYHAGKDWSVPLHLSARMKQLEKKYRIREVDGWPIPAIKRYCAVFSVSGGRDLNALFNSLRSENSVASAQPMNQFIAQGRAYNPLESNGRSLYNDPKFGLQYGRYAAAVENLHQLTRGKHVKVGIVDSAADKTHPDLRGQIKQQYYYVSADQPLDKLHGTAVTGVIAAAADNGVGVVGLAPDASVYVYAACSHINGRTVCTSFSLAKALQQALDDEIDVLNLSLTGPEDELLAMLINAAHERGVSIVAANATPENVAVDKQAPTKHNFPASMPAVIAVPGGPQALWFARDEQLSTQAGGGYQFFYGSSMATAGTTGLVALLRSHWTAAETRKLLNTLSIAPCDTTLIQSESDHLLLTLRQSANCGQSHRVAPAMPRPQS